MAEFASPAEEAAHYKAELAAKQEELDTLPTNFDEFSSSSQELEVELEAELRRVSPSPVFDRRSEQLCILPVAVAAAGREQRLGVRGAQE